MALAMTIEKQSTKFVKPFVQTPPTHRRYKLGLIDEFVAAVNVSVVLFFNANCNHTEKYVPLLEKSLQKILTRLYPLAGRYDEETKTVDCNDQGAEFIHAKVNIKLQDILVTHVDVKFLDEFVPSKIVTRHQYHDSLLAIQVTTFECGGVALGVSATHKIVDASTLCTVINEWAVMNREENEAKLAGSFFNSSSLFPGRNLGSFTPDYMSHDELSKYTLMKLSFSESVISNLKVKGSTINRQWSKVQVVAGIIWKTLIHVDTIIHNVPREAIVIQAINIREKMSSLIPKNSCGNLWGLCATKYTTRETIEELIDRLSDSVKKTITDFSKANHNNEEGQMVVLNSFIHMANILGSTNVIPISSWCKFPFYEADFGFGKPIWVAPRTIPIKNVVSLMDDAGGNGVEAYVFLQVKDIPYFEKALHYVNTFPV